MDQTIQLDSEYKSFIKKIKARIISTRMRAVLAVNSEQIKLYWTLGKMIIERQQTSHWGSKLLEQISSDLTAEFPDMKGFSRSNIHAMKQFAQAYPTQEIVQQPVGQLPWGHIVVLIQKVKDGVAREWYAMQTLKQGWARDALTRHIKMDLFATQGKDGHKLTNFSQRLPAMQSDLAHEFIQDPLDLGFLPIIQGAREQEIELGLVHHVRKLLLRLGKGFAFVGNQYHLEVGGDDFYIDLLFFNIKLNAYVICELKKGKFKPEYAGKLNFYLSVVDQQVKEEHHNPSLGLLLCESRNRVVAEYSLSRTDSPMGIAQYELSKKLPEKLQEVLPSTALLEDKLADELTDNTNYQNE